MEYKLLTSILTADRILDIWQSEKEDQARRKPILNAERVNDQVEALLIDPKYTLVNGRLIMGLE